MDEYFTNTIFLLQNGCTEFGLVHFFRMIRARFFLSFKILTKSVRWEEWLAGEPPDNLTAYRRCCILSRQLGPGFLVKKKSVHLSVRCLICTCC